MSPEERARRIKWGIPDDPAKRAPTPAQRAAIDRLTGNPPGGSAPRAGRPDAAPPGRPRATPPPDRLRSPVAPRPAPVRDQRAETADPKARHAADPSTVADHTRPRAGDRRPDASNRPVADRPATDRPVANRPGTDGPAGDRPDSSGAADAPSDHDTRDGTADLDATQAEIADLKKQLADRDGKLDTAQARIADLEARLADRETPSEAAGPWSGDREPPVADRDAKPDAETPRIDGQDAAPDAASAEIIELRGQLDAANATIAAQATEIGALNEKTTAHDRAIGDLLGRLQRMENAGADGPARGVDLRESPRSEAPVESAGSRRVDAPPTGAIADGAPVADEAKHERRSLRPMMWEAAVTGSALTSAAMTIGPHVPAYVAGIGAGVMGAAKPIALLARELARNIGTWYRNRRTEPNAD